MKNLTTHLASTQYELDIIKEQLFGQNCALTHAINSTSSQMSELRNIWKELNATVEKTTDLTNKVILITQWYGYFIYVRKECNTFQLD